MHVLRELSALLLLAGSAALARPDCTTVNDYFERGIRTTTLPVSTETHVVVSTPTSTVTRTIRAPRTVTFLSVATAITTSVVLAPTPVSIVTVTPTSFSIAVPRSTSFAPTFTSTVVTTVITPSATVQETSTFYDQTPVPYLEAALAPTPTELPPLITPQDQNTRPKRSLGDSNADTVGADSIAAQLAARSGPLGKRAVSRALIRPQHIRGRIIYCQATVTETTTSTATPFLVTKSILARPTASKTTTIVFTATSTSTPAGTVELQTAQPVTSTLTATETITIVSTPTSSFSTQTTIAGPASTEVTELHRSRFCSPERVTIQTDYVGSPAYCTEETLAASSREECCDAASQYSGATAYFFSSESCYAVVCPVDQCQADSATAIRGAVIGQNSIYFTMGMLQCSTGYSLPQPAQQR